MRCMECGKRFGIAEYADELDENVWNQISNRSCDRT
ncbi:MAG: hypothetical protein M0024_00905 [Nitrospiraceae bacterium]|nr:hypothetical protein [Nitrospiraceae bacterium]